MMRNNSFPRWLAVFSVLAIVAVVTGGVWFHRTQERQLRQNAQTQLQAIARLKADQIAAWRHERLADAHVLLENPFLSEQVARFMASPHPENTKEMLTQLRSVQEHYHYFDVLLVDAHGQVRLHARASHDSLCPQAAHVLTGNLRKRRPTLTDIHADFGKMPFHIDSIAPIFAGTGKTDKQVGAIILQADVQRFLYLEIQSWPTPSRSAETLLVRRDGNSVLYLNELRHQKHTALKLRIALSRKDVPSVMAALGRRGVVEGTDYRGVEVLSALEAVPDSPWFLVAKVDAAEVFAAWNLESAIILALTLLLVLVAVAGVGLVWQRNDKAHYQDLAQGQAALHEDKEKLAVTLRSIGDGVIATNADGVVTVLNNAAAALTGWNPDEAVGQPFETVFNAVNETTRKPITDVVRRVLETGTPVEMAKDIVLISRMGAEKPIEDSCAPILDADGSVAGVALVFRDVTEHKQAEEVLRESEERYQVIFDGSAQGILIADGNTRQFMYANPSICRMLGYTERELLQLGVADIHPKDSLSHVASEFESQMRGEKALASGLPCLRKDGTVFYADITATRIILEGGRECNVGFFTDVTERKQAEDALRESENAFRTLFETSHDAIMTLEPPSWEFTTCNQAMVEMFGTKDAEEFKSRAPWEVSPEMQPDGRASSDKAKEMIETAMREGSHFFEWTHMRISGEEFPCTVLLSRIEQGGKAFLQATVRDVTDQEQAEEALRESEEKYRIVFEGSNHGILMTDNETRQFLYANQTICRMLGYTESELLKLGIADIAPKDLLGQVVAEFESQAQGENALASELPCLRKDGTVFYADVTSAQTIFEGGRECTVGFFSDITERKKAKEALIDARAEIEAANRQLLAALARANQLTTQAEGAKEQLEVQAVELSHQATHDSLTGLPNRQYFEQHLGKLIKRMAGKKSRLMTVLFLDLDKFKLINDTLGHKGGDSLLIETGERLQSCLRSEDLLARMDGDEFTVILPRCQSRSIAESVAARMIDSISRPFEIQGRKFVIGVSIGLAHYPSDGMDAVTLLKHADAAMYKAKQAGRGTFRWFTGDVDVDNQQRADMEMDIRATLEKGRFNVNYQPIVSLEDGNILAAEALLRWEHPEKGMISPSLFIPIAEEIGVIGQIGNYVLRTACAQTMAWRDEGIHLSQIGVNVSTAQVRDAGWLDSVSAALSDTGLDARCLSLEVTETDFAAEYESIGETLQRMRQLGIGIAIDDFGVGQSSLSRVKDFPVTHLKIDGSFVRDIEHNKDDSALVRSIVEMAHGQGIEVTAEWVETESQMEILRSIGCDYAQGYFVSPALCAEAFGDFVREWMFAQRKADAA